VREFEILARPATTVRKLAHTAQFRVAKHRSFSSSCVLLEVSQTKCHCTSET
jgi:hypothetical protein